jgi:putative ABC transport system substrate-binding protein
LVSRNRCTSSIPIVFSSADNPVRLGLVASLNRPGGNITGMAAFIDELTAKRLEMLHEMVPSAKSIGMLADAGTNDSQAREAQRAAAVLGVQLQLLRVSPSEQLETAFAELKRREVKAILLAGSGFFVTREAQLIKLAAQYEMPVSYFRREFVRAGGLFSYGVNILEIYRQAGDYAGRILKGEKPADLPVLQPTRFEFAINLRTARALGLEIPLKLRSFADEVIE